MWYLLEMWAWFFGLIAEAALVFLLLRHGRFRNRPWFFFFLAYDFCFSVILYAVNHFGGAHALYPQIWQFMQPLDGLLLGAVVLEALGACNYLGFLLLIFTYIIGIVIADSASNVRHVLTACAMLGFVGSAMLALCRRNLVLIVYIGCLVVQYMAILWGSKRWHAGAYAEVLSLACYSAWIIAEFKPRTLTSDRLTAKENYGNTNGN